jgi:short-subunit dehydrogenase
MKSLSDKTVLITGATGGFGHEFARQLIGAGARIILSGRDEAKLGEIAARCSQERGPGKVIGAITADLAGRAGCEELYTRCREITPDLDILINNAGSIAYGHFHEVPMDTWERLLETNLLSAMRLTYLFLPSMLERKIGHIVLMSSVAGFVGTRNSTAYSASKFGMRGFGLSLYSEVHRQGVDVTVLYPFWADTPILDSMDYGKESTGTVIKPLVDRADDVIRESLLGIRKRRLSVYPGPTAKVLHFFNKFVQLRGSQRKGSRPEHAQ